MSHPTHIVPAEWEPHAALWTAWPSDAELWLDDLEPARAAVGDMCRALVAGGERVELLAPAALHPELTDLGVQLHDVPFGDIWLRDTGPIFARIDGALTATRFGWNGWGGKYHFPADDLVGDAIAERVGLEPTRHDWILEGGAVDWDGAGTVLTTRQCLLNPNRNPQLGERDYEQLLRDALGAERVVWLGDGLANDHTDGHVDNIARFVATGVVACMAPSGADDPNADVLRAIADDLRAAGFELALVPSPGRVLDASGALMPASHLNFIIGDGAVVVPVYRTAYDDAAVAAIAELFPGRTTVGVDARGLLTGGGAFHCITREQPR